MPKPPSREEFNSFLASVQNNLDKLTHEQQLELNETLKQLERAELIEKAKKDFEIYINLVGHVLIPGGYKFSSRGQHHRLVRALEEVADGDMDRLTVSMPPRFSKSATCSILFVSWCIGKYPNWKIIQASSTDDLATDFGRDVKKIISSEEYQEIFPGIKISKDSSASGKFSIDGYAGVYFAVGMGGRIAGKGADLFIADDLVSEREALSGDPTVYDKAWMWYMAGPMQRLQPFGRILQVATRWSKADPIGRVKRRMKEDPDNADQYVSIEIAALDENDESSFPELWPTKLLIRKRANMDSILWSAQYQQNPTASENSIVPRAHWRRWDKFKRIPGTIDEAEFIPPECHWTLMVMDTSYTKKKRSNPTAITVWGVFYREEDGKEQQFIILLHGFKKKMSQGELKIEAKKLIAEWKPDSVLIEMKSSGPFLRSELLEAGIFTDGVTPGPNDDKVSRLNSIADIFRSLRVWYIPTRENDDVIQEVADFPNGAEDDYTDTVAYALRRFRSGGFVTTNNDEFDEDDNKPVDRAYY